MRLYPEGLPAQSLVHYILVTMHQRQDKPGSIHYLMIPTVTVKFIDILWTTPQVIHLQFFNESSSDLFTSFKQRLKVSQQSVDSLLSNPLTS